MGVRMKKRMIIAFGIYLANYSIHSMELAKKTEAKNKEYAWVYKLYGLDTIFSTLPEKIKDKIKNEAFPSQVWYEDEIIEQKDKGRISSLESKLLQKCFLENSSSGTIVKCGGNSYIVNPSIAQENLIIEKALFNAQFDKLMLGGSNNCHYVYRSYKNKTLEQALYSRFSSRFGDSKK